MCQVKVSQDIRIVDGNIGPERRIGQHDVKRLEPDELGSLHRTTANIGTRQGEAVETEDAPMAVIVDEHIHLRGTLELRVHVDAYQTGTRVCGSLTKDRVGIPESPHFNLTGSRTSEFSGSPIPISLK